MAIQRLQSPTKRGVAVALVALCLLLFAATPAPRAIASGGGVTISEIRIDQSGTDNDEYFELAGTPGAALDGYTYLVIGDGLGSGTIEAVVDLTGQAIPGSGFFVAAEATFTLGTPDLVTNLNFENSDNVTHVLVQGFTGADGDDLDTDDDGVLDVTPWAGIVDLIALIEEPNPPLNTEYHYGPPTVGPDGPFVPGHAYVCPSGWEIGAFDPLGATDTPGAANPCPTSLAISEIRIDQSGSDNDEYFELAGDPGLALDDYTYLVIGDGAGGSGVIEAVVDLTGSVIPGSGFFVAAEATFTLGTPDLVTNLNFENSDNVTHVLVQDFTGADGDDLDTDDDGALDVTPWAGIVDLIALIEEPNPPLNTEYHYGPPTVGPDGPFVPGHAYVCPDGWEIGAFDPLGADDTPGAANPCEAPVALAINEIRIDQPGSDNDEYFELAGTPGAALDGTTYLVIGDGAGDSGVIEAVVDLTGQVMPGSGYFVAAEATFTLGVADFVTTLNFENSDNVTHLLVSGFTGLDGDDLDTDDDGVLDVTPWAELIALIALIEEENPPLNTEYHYGPPTVGPDGSFVPGHAFLCPDGWQIGAFDPVGGLDTPGAENDCGVTLTIMQIQAAAQKSPFEGTFVTDVPGIVTAVGGNGFYMQDAAGDADDATSDGIFVFTGGAPGVAVGDAVEVTGTVDEFYPGGMATGNLSTTELVNPTVTVLSSGNPVPAAVILGTGGRVPPNTVIDDDGNTTYDPALDGLDFYESMEGMRVQVNDALVVGSNRFGEIAVVGDNGANATGFTNRGGLFIQPTDFNPERIIFDDGLAGPAPIVSVGDGFAAPLVGVVDYSFGNFKILSPSPLPAVLPGGLAAETTSLSSGPNTVTVATYNVENLDPFDDLSKIDGLASQIVFNMGAPDIIGLQEIQDNSGETDDGIVAADVTYGTLIAAIAAAGGPAYDYREISPLNNQDGGAPGSNIRVGFLFQPGRVSFVDRPGGDATTPTVPVVGGSGVELTFSPGRIDPNNIAFFDSRKPLAGEFIFNSHKLFVVVAHFNSKSGDDPLFGETQPPILNSEVQRLQQAQAVNDFVDSILALNADANVVIAGDLNDFQFSPPLATLEGGVLTNLHGTLPLEEQYTYIFDGNSQVLDHILLSNGLFADAFAGFDVVHANAEFSTASRPTDHEPAVAALNLACSPTLLLDQAIASVNALVADGVLNAGQGNALIAKLNAARARIANGQIKAAMNVLNAFINQVNAFELAGTLSAAQADVLRDAAQAVLDCLTASEPLAAWPGSSLTALSLLGAIGLVGLARVRRPL